MSWTIGFLGDLHYIFLLVLNTFIYLKLEIAYHYQKEFVNCLIYYPEGFGLPVSNDILLKFVVSSSETSDIIWCFTADIISHILIITSGIWLVCNTNY